MSGAESQNAEVRVKFDDDQTVAASGGNGPSPAEDAGDDSDADRNKRYLPFGGGHGDGHAAAGSGNFLFDIIRVSQGQWHGNCGKRVEVGAWLKTGSKLRKKSSFTVFLLG